MRQWRLLRLEWGSGSFRKVWPTENRRALYSEAYRDFPSIEMQLVYKRQEGFPAVLNFLDVMRAAGNMQGRVEN